MRRGSRGWYASVPLLLAVVAFPLLGPPQRHATGEDVAAKPVAPAGAAKGTQEKQGGAPKGEAPYGGDGSNTDRSKLPDSFKYYGPNGLWARWNDSQKLGRDTWIFSTFGNQKFYHILARFGGELGLSVDFFRLLDTRRRKDRFADLGLINEPNFESGGKDEWGFQLDKWRGDPVPGAYPVDDRWYGRPTGIIGLRSFPNPAFTEVMKREWLKDPDASVRRYFDSPGKIEPPRLVGITCALCHIAFDPLNPPNDTANPRWENLAANIGNQYFREGDLFFGKGRVVGGNANPLPRPTGATGPADPYDTKGLGEESFLYQYGHTQPPGTSETSRFSYDFINNPNTINQIYNIGTRSTFHETTDDGVKLTTTHILKDGADSIGLLGALLRVPINIGSEGDYWATRLWNPVSGQAQKPFSIREVKFEVSEERQRELRKEFPELGEAWKETERRVPSLASYLASYTPARLADVKDKNGHSKYISKDCEQLKRGALAYADQCAKCHSNKQPFYPLASEKDKQQFYRGLVLSDDFLSGNTLSDDVRYPFNAPGLGINAARALATNAIDGDIWADFSSADYKALPAIRQTTFVNPLNLLDGGRYGSTPIVVDFVAPGGGRGYYRTAALNSLWTSAPYLHNNAVGKSPVTADGSIDPRYVTVEGRLELFEDAIDQLLNPDKRRPFIKVTSADSGLTEGMPGLKARLSGLLRDLAKEKARGAFVKIVADVVRRSDLPDELKPAVGLAVGDLLERLEPEIDKYYTQANISRIKSEVVTQVRGQIDALIAGKLKGRPRLQALVAQLKPEFDAAFLAHADDLAEVFNTELKIPKGMPLNLILNLNVSKAPYALAAYLKTKGDPRALAEALLKLSDCPDLVENKGHTYGADLSSQEKRDLIEYLKTL